LNQGRLFNDELINFYFKLINKSCGNKIVTINSFFITRMRSLGATDRRLLRWTRKVTLHDKDMVLLPIHQLNHWQLAVINPAKKIFGYYCSLNDQEQDTPKLIREWWGMVVQHETKEKWDSTDWTDAKLQGPEQTNGTDCGVFVCKVAEYLASGSLVTFDQTNIGDFRRTMLGELLQDVLKTYQYQVGIPSHALSCCQHEGYR
jgi:sentrin-specific protease 2 (axin associating molecule)